MDINIGIKQANREQIVAGLHVLLVNSYTLYLKTHNYHWDMTGPMFNTLHLMFEQQYTELAAAVDQIAERIRALGAFAPGSYTEYARLTSIPEDETVPDAETMIKNLVAGQETLARQARDVMATVGESRDEPTADLLTQRMQVHEKNAWMLRSLIQ
ncbi:MAG: DNA starvation/stationary phase protection protein [Proteobacteria bacterium]|nr:DNA starvation/stationary phase protection protein [Pseudomonadota bacterium]